MTTPDKVTMLNEKGIRVEVDANPEAIDIESVFLRKVDPFRRFYVFEVTTRIKYPSVGGLGLVDDYETEVYIDGNDRSLYYGPEEDQEYPDGVPGMAVLSVHLPKHPQFWHRLVPASRRRKPLWHVTSNEFHDKYSVELVAWYGTY